MSIVYGTGMEAGSIEIFPPADMLDSSFIQASGVALAHTGNYALGVIKPAAGENWVRMPLSGTVSEAWFSVWLTPRGFAKELRVEFLLGDGSTVGFRKDTSEVVLNAYVGSSKVANGTIDINTDGGYHLLEGHVLVADGSGQLDLSIDGVIEHQLVLDTKDGTSAIIDYLRFYIDNTSFLDNFVTDDLTISETEAPGDIRYISRIPNGDSAVTWTPSGGPTNYTLVDEIPPVDADYVETAVNANQDLYDLTDYTLNNVIVGIVQWLRGQTTPAGGEMTLLTSSSGSVTGTTTSGLGTSEEYNSRIVQNDPDTGLAWTKTGFNASLWGQEAVVSAETVRATQHVLEIGYNQQQALVVRPLGMDVDLNNGSRVWVTTWEAGTMFLKRFPFTLGVPTSFSFGAATEADIVARTFYLAPYCPGFFGTAGLSDIIYVYGRWNDGTVTHIEKSIDGGTTFTDIGDSGTWGAGWVGGFLADDADILYAFVNGASRALYRSVNAGVAWTSLSSLPFDVEAGGVSKHPDGRILIINRTAAGQMVAYAEPPDYSSWIDATGSPSFPTAGGGANSVIWIT
jgi:hypothetical protein